MEIRGEISSGKPALLPHKIFSDNYENDESTNYIGNNYLLNFVNRVSNGSMRKSTRKNTIGNLNNLAPVAARSISRIAESIKHEEAEIPANIRDFCPNCNMQVIKATNYCAHCGERI